MLCMNPSCEDEADIVIVFRYNLPGKIGTWRKTEPMCIKHGERWLKPVEGNRNMDLKIEWVE